MPTRTMIINQRNRTLLMPGYNVVSYGRGRPCEKGETKESTGCIPASGDPGAGDRDNEKDQRGRTLTGNLFSQDEQERYVQGIVSWLRPERTEPVDFSTLMGGAASESGDQKMPSVEEFHQILENMESKGMIDLFRINDRTLIDEKDHSVIFERSSFPGGESSGFYFAFLTKKIREERNL